MNNEERDKSQIAKAGRKIDDVEEIEKGKCIQKKQMDIQKAAGHGAVVCPR